MVTRRKWKRAGWVLTYACPSNCKYCQTRELRGGVEWTSQQAEACARQLRHAGFEEVLLLGGEPLLSPHLQKVCSILGDDCRIILFTAGAGLSGSEVVERLPPQVKKVVLSLDAADERLNDRLRGRKGSLRNVLEVADALRTRRQNVALGFNSVVSRSTVDQAWGLLDIVKKFRPQEWTVTLVGDIFTLKPVEHFLDPDALWHWYADVVPELWKAAIASGIHLVPMPVPWPFLARNVPPSHWAVASRELKSEMSRELERFSKGDYNKSFIERRPCPLFGQEIGLGVAGEVYPCTQQCILQPTYVVGRLQEKPLMEIVESQQMERFGAGIPHEACLRCWGPSTSDLAPCEPRWVSAAGPSKK